MSIINLFLSENHNLWPFVAVVVLLLALIFFGIFRDLPGLWSQKTVTEEDLLEARRHMVDQDLKARGIRDRRVLEAMAAVPRHLFVSKKYWASAYKDHPLPIEYGQTISQPYIVALMTELLELKGEEKVLEVGTGSGYQAAVLSLLAKEVYTVEILPGLAETARQTLEQLGYTNVQVKLGDGYYGWEEKRPFDGIVITASSPEIPALLWEQLREGGRLVMPQGDQRETQRLIRIRKVGGKPQIEDITGVLFVPMTGRMEDPPQRETGK